MADVLLIANPAASGFTGGLHRDVVRILRGSHAVEAVWPTSAGQVESLALAGIREGVDIIVAFGGDGIAHHVACVLRSTGVSMGIIPAGTTNVFARIVGLPNKPRAAAQILTEVTTSRPVSTAHVRGSARGHAVDTCATFAAGVGLDADVVAIAEQEPYRKYRFGAVHYARTAGSVLIKDYRKRPASLKVTAGSNVAFGVTALIQVHAPYTYFGRMPLALAGPGSEGLSVMIVEDLRLLRLPSIIARAVRGKNLDRISGLEVWADLEVVTVEAEPAAALQTDGELIGLMSELTVTSELEALRVIAPSGG